MFLVPPGGAR
ncbi:hypothetical protein LINPERHAP2_LOCUS7747 [Linum perenne]